MIRASSAKMSSPIDRTNSRVGFGRWEHDVIPGGDDQREEAFRLGINLVMYALCLDYKTEQAHIDYMLRTRRLPR